MRDKLIAEKTVIKNEEGYLVKQYHDGQPVAEQFVTKDCYEEFCRSVGQVPELIGRGVRK